MKKRLISLLVALCMAVTLLPVSAITAWAEEGDQLKIVNGYPVGSGGEDWSYDGATLELHPANPTEYDFSKLVSGTGNALECALTIGKSATIVGGNFTNNVINNGKISGGYFSSSSLINHGSITGGKFLYAITNESSGTIENGTFLSTVTNSGNIKGGIFSEQPTGGHVAKGYTLNVNLRNPGIYTISKAEINGLSKSGYVIPNTDYNTSVTIQYTFHHSSPKILFPIDVTFGNTNDTPCLLKDWAPGASYSTNNHGGDFSVTFTAPLPTEDTVTLSILTRLVIDENGYPVGPMGSNKKYSGNGWNFDASNNTLTLESGRYDFSGEKNALRPLNPNVQLVVEPGAKLTGGAAGDGSGVTWQLTENTDDPSTYKLTIRGSGAMEDYLMSSNQPWRSFRDQITSVVVSPGVTSIGNLAFTRFSKLIHVDIADSVVSIGEQAFSDCSSLTDIKIPQSVTYIGVKAFGSCTKLSSITLSTNNITSIRLYTFSGCSELSSIVIPDGVTSIQLGAFSNCTKLTSITIPGSVTSIGSNVFDGCTRLNDIRYSGTSENVISALSGYVPTLVTFNYGDKVPEAERMITVSVKTGETLTAPTTIPTVSGYEFKGWRTKDGEPYDFTVAPTGKFTLYANWEKIPDPKPDPKPEPETPTYTLTVKGGTFTYNGGEAMTSANVPVDAEVKVTLNQSAVPEGMVFDLWAMDEASLLGNPAVAYNEESFTIPAGSVAKGSTVTVEAQYRDATIESEPSVLGTAAIIGVAGAGTAVIVWQGYRIGMELYEKYFQPTPEETAAEQPAPEAPAAAAAS